MYKEISIDNWILGGTIFLLIFTLGCYLWFQNEMAYLQPQDTEVERQYLEKSSEMKQIETPQIESTDTVQPDASEKNSSNSEDTADRVPDVSAGDTQQRNTVNRILVVPLAVINNVQRN